MIVYGMFVEVSISKLLIAGFVTAIVHATMIVTRCRLNPDLAPRISEEITLADHLYALKDAWPLIVIVIGIIGGLFSGDATRRHEPSRYQERHRRSGGTGEYFSRVSMVLGVRLRRRDSGDRVSSDRHVSSGAQNGAPDESFFLSRPECMEDFRKQNTVYTGGIANGDYSFMCNKEVRSITDIRGKRIRTSGAGGRWVRALGAVPIGMAVPDAVETYRRGSIDCVMGPMYCLQSFGLIDATKYVLEYPMGPYKVTGILLMNRDAWNKITSAERAAIIRAMAFRSAQSICNGHLVNITMAGSR